MGIKFNKSLKLQAVGSNNNKFSNEITITGEIIDQHYSFFRPQGRISKIKQRIAEIFEFFQVSSHWIYSNEKGNKIKLIIEANSISQIIELKNILTHFSNYDLSDKTEVQKRGLDDRLSKYIRAVNKTCPVIGWECEEVVKKIKEKMSPKGDKDSKVNDILINGNVTFYNEQYGIEPLHVSPREFLNLINIMSVLRDRLNQVLKPQHIDYLNPNDEKNLISLTSGIRRIIRREQTIHRGFKIIETPKYFEKVTLNEKQKSIFQENNALIQKAKIEFSSNPFSFSEQSQLYNQKQIFVDNIFKIFFLFYECFLPSLLPKLKELFSQIKEKKLLIFPLKEIKNRSEILNYVVIKNEAEFINFCLNSNSVYYMLCSWFLMNPLSKYWAKNNEVYSETHHIVPVFLQKNDYPFVDINKSFNLIIIPYPFHLLLHSIRFIEFGSIKDQQATNFVARKLNFYYRKKEYFSLFNNNIINIERLLKNLEIDIINDEFYEYLKNIFNSFDKNFKVFFENTMIWKNIKYDCISLLIIPKNTVTSPRELILKLKNHIKTCFELISEPQPEEYSTLTNHTFKQGIIHYLSKSGSRTHCYHFNLKQFENFSLKKKRKNQDSQRLAVTNKALLQFLEKFSIWEYKNLNLTVSIKPNQFSKLRDLVQYLISHLPKDHQNFSKVQNISKISQQFSVLIRNKKQRKLVYGWNIKETQSE